MSHTVNISYGQVVCRLVGYIVEKVTFRGYPRALVKALKLLYMKNLTHFTLFKQVSIGKFYYIYAFVKI